MIIADRPPFAFLNTIFLLLLLLTALVEGCARLRVWLEGAAGRQSD